GIAEIVDDTVVQAAIARARGERDIGNVQRAQRVRNHVAAETWRIGAGRRRALEAGDGGVGGIGFGACSRGLGRRHGRHFLNGWGFGGGWAASNRIAGRYATGREVTAWPLVAGRASQP